MNSDIVGVTGHIATSRSETLTTLCDILESSDSPAHYIPKDHTAFSELLKVLKSLDEAMIVALVHLATHTEEQPKESNPPKGGTVFVS